MRAGCELTQEVRKALYRSRGPASRIDLADRWLGLVRIGLDVNAKNTRAMALYEEKGFVEEGRLRAHFLRDGELVDTVLMGRVRPSPQPPFEG